MGLIGTSEGWVGALQTSLTFGRAPAGTETAERVRRDSPSLGSSLCCREQAGSLQGQTPGYCRVGAARALYAVFCIPRFERRC